MEKDWQEADHNLNSGYRWVAGILAPAAITELSYFSRFCRLEVGGQGASRLVLVRALSLCPHVASPLGVQGETQRSLASLPISALIP